MKPARKVKVGAVVEVAVAQKLPQVMEWMLGDVVALSVVDVIRLENLSRMGIGVRTMGVIIVCSIEAI